MLVLHCKDNHFDRQNNRLIYILLQTLQIIDMNQGIFFVYTYILVYGNNQGHRHYIKY